MTQRELNPRQMEYVEMAAVAIVIGLAGDNATQIANIPVLAFDIAVAMMDEREKRFGPIAQLD